MSNGSILVYDDRDRSWGLYTTFAARMRFAPGEPYPRGPKDSYYNFSPSKGRVLHEYQITYLSEGGGWFRSESLGRSNVQELHAGSFFILFPGEWHSYSPDAGTGWCEYSIGFSGSRMEELEGKGFVSRNHPILRTGLNETLNGLFSSVFRTAIEQYPGYQQVLSGLISNIVSYALYLDNNSQVDKGFFDKHITRAKEIIYEEYFSITPREMASRIGMGYTNFRGLFKKYTNISPAQFIMNVKLLKAKELLTYSDCSVKEIAYKIGMENYDYFSTFFKGKTGYTPLEYRSYSRGDNKETK